MKETLREIFSYFKNPVLEKDKNTNYKYRLLKTYYLLLISIITSILIMPLFFAIESMGLVNPKQHAMDDFLNTYSKPMVFIIVVVLGPIVEELFFRAPLTLFKNKKAFGSIFYSFAIIFGLVHITNFGITTNVLLLAPILVAPQIILGGYLGFIRVRFGLSWSILLHACYNAFFIVLTFAEDLA